MKSGFENRNGRPAAERRSFIFALGIGLAATGVHGAAAKTTRDAGSME